MLITQPAGPRGARRIEVPHDVIELQQQFSIPLDGESVGDDPEHARVSFELATGFVGERNQVDEEWLGHVGLENP